MRERQKLGQLLVNAGVVGQDVMDAVLREQAADGRRLGEMLMARGIVTGAVLTQVLAHHIRIAAMLNEPLAHKPNLYHPH